MFKVNNKDTRLGKVNDKDTVDVVLVSIVDFDQLIAGWGCCLLFWRFVLAGISLDKVST